MSTTHCPDIVNPVRQRTGKDCGYAVAAMAADVTYEQAMEAAKSTFGDVPEHLSSRDLDRLLTALGCEPVRMMYPRILTPGFYVLVVPSLNLPGLMHYVLSCWVEIVGESGEKEPDLGLYLWDPQDGNPNKQAYTAETLMSWCEPVRITRPRPPHAADLTYYRGVEAAQAAAL